jgi:hypothetical protein
MLDFTITILKKLKINNPIFIINYYVLILSDTNTKMAHNRNYCMNRPWTDPIFYDSDDDDLNNTTKSHNVSNMSNTTTPIPCHKKSLVPRQSSIRSNIQDSYTTSTIK